ncbi:MAG: hypothetical protein P4L31_02985 [Candidatus Babeliales bacterium]|nr:hypothetical protein [Candidatus Babeliales bacterium]
MQKLTLSLIFSTSTILGMQTPQPTVYKTDQIQLKQQTCDQRTVYFLEFIHNGKRCDMLKTVYHSMDNHTSIDCGNTPLSQEECAQKFAHIEELAKQAQLTQCPK